LICGLIAGSLVLILVSGCSKDEKGSVDMRVTPVTSEEPVSSPAQTPRKNSLLGEWKYVAADGKTVEFHLTITSITEGELVASHGVITRNYGGGKAKLHQGLIKGNFNASPTNEVTCKSDSRSIGDDRADSSSSASGRATIT